MLKEHKRTWVSELPVVEFEINSTINDSTGYSPFYVAYGQEATKPADLLEGLSPNPAARNFANRITTIYHVVRTRLEKAQASQKYQVDKQHCDASFQVGDHILLDTRNLALPEMCKLADRYVGPFRITAKAGPTAYCLELPNNMVKKQRSNNRGGETPIPPTKRTRDKVCRLTKFVNSYKQTSVSLTNC